MPQEGDVSRGPLPGHDVLVDDEVEHGAGGGAGGGAWRVPGAREQVVCPRRLQLQRFPQSANVLVRRPGEPATDSGTFSTERDSLRPETCQVRAVSLQL